jgi:glutathionylspermidine synthase
VETQGLTYATDRTADGGRRPYWDESAAYVFSAAEIDHLEDVTERLHALCLEAVHRMATDPTTSRALGLPPETVELVRRSLAGPDPEAGSLYGRFDLVWDGRGPAKMLEYNADTPTGLVEAAVVQWHWLEDLFPDRDQWNLVHERLVLTWKRIGADVPAGLVHLAAGLEEPQEDWATIA